MASRRYERNCTVNTQLVRLNQSRTFVSSSLELIWQNRKHNVLDVEKVRQWTSFLSQLFINLFWKEKDMPLNNLTLPSGRYTLQAASMGTNTTAVEPVTSERHCCAVLSSLNPTPNKIDGHPLHLDSSAGHGKTWPQLTSITSQMSLEMSMATQHPRPSRKWTHLDFSPWSNIADSVVTHFICHPSRYPLRPFKTDMAKSFIGSGYLTY